MRVPAGFVGAAALFGLLAGCAQPAHTAPSGPRTAAGPSQLPSACSKGNQRLTVSSQVVHPGDLATVSRNGSWPSGEIPGPVPLQSPGELGIESNQQFKPLYYIFASIAGMTKYSQDIAFGPTVAVAGAALPDKDFRIKVPDVSPGNYVIEFEYGLSSVRRPVTPINYLLCAQLSII